MERVEGSHKRPGRFIWETEDGNFGLQRKKILRVMWDHGPNK